MEAGLQAFDPVTGATNMDISTIVGRLIATIDASAMGGSVAVAGLDQGIPFAIPIMDSTYGDHWSEAGRYSCPTITLPVCTFSGNVVSWTRQAMPANTVAAPACQLILGVR